MPSLRRTRRGAALSLLLLLALAALGCTRRATQLIVVVETDLVAGTDYRCFGLLVSRLEASGAVEPGATRRFLAVPADATAPFSFGVTPPDGDARRRVEVAVEALDDCSDPGPADRVVRRAVRTGFLPEQSLRVPLYLPASCGDGCTVTESCPAVGPDCVPIPTVEPTDLAPTQPGLELVDASIGTDAAAPTDDAAGLDAPGLDAPGPDAPGLDAPSIAADAALVVDSAPLSDADLPTTCTTARANTFGGFSITGPFVVVPRFATAGWRAFWDTGGSTSLLDDPGGMNRLVVTTLPLTTERLVPFGAVTTSGDDIQLLGTIAGQSSVLRWWGPAYDTPLEVLTAGPLRPVAPAALPSGELLAVIDEGPGARNVLWRLPALSGSPLSIGTLASDSETPVLASRIGGALAAIAGSVGSCSVIALAADGSPAAPITVPVSGVCALAAIADLDGTRAVLAHVSGRDGMEQGAVQIVDVSSGAVSEPIPLGRALANHVEVHRDAVTGGFRVVWQDPTALSSLAFDTSLRPGTRHCIEDAPGATMTDYRSFRSAQRAGTTDVMFLGGTRGGLVHVELSGP